MVSIENLYKFKLENKYTDLNINIFDNQINVHKIFVCEKSPFIKNILKYDNKIDISLPDDTSIESFNIVINFLYGKFCETNNLTFVINTFNFLGIDNTYIFDYLTKSVPINKELSSEHKNAIINVHDKNIINFFGYELLDRIDIPDDELIFGRKMCHSKLITFFQSKDDPNINLDHCEWHYFNNFEMYDDDKKFTALGYNWSIYRSVWGFEETHDSIILELNDQTLDSFRIILILFTEQRTTQRYFLYDCSNQDELKILAGNHRVRNCGINIYPRCHERVRISLFLQKL
jgi:hypothetical protein